MANRAIQTNKPQAQHHLNGCTAKMDFKSKVAPPSSLTYTLPKNRPNRRPVLQWQNIKRLQALDVFVDDLIALYQGGVFFSTP